MSERRFYLSDGMACCNQLHLKGDFHNPDCPKLRKFPIQGGGSIPWWLAEVAFEYYGAHYTGQSLEQLARRGGFGVVELVAFIRGEDPGEKSWYPASEKCV